MFQVRGFYGWGNLAPTTGDSVAPDGHSFHHNSMEPSQDSTFHSARIQSSPLRASEQCTESLSQQEKRVPDVLDTMIEQARTEKELVCHHGSLRKRTNQESYSISRMMKTRRTLN